MMAACDEKHLLVTRNVMDEDFMESIGLHTANLKDEELSLKQVDMDALFGLKPEHYENIPKDGIGRKAPEDAVDTLVEHLVEQMTGINVNDIDTILGTQVPKGVNEAVSKVINLLEPHLTRAWEHARNSEAQVHVNSANDSGSEHVIPYAFYEALHQSLYKIYRNETFDDPVFDYLHQLCIDSTKKSFHSTAYHDSWKGFIISLLSTLCARSSSEQECKKRNEHTASLRQSEVGFKVDCTLNNGKYIPVLQSTPDALLNMHSVLNLPNEVECVLATPVLALEVKTSYTETAGYIPGEVWGGIASSPSLSWMDEDSLPGTSALPERRVTLSSSSHSNKVSDTVPDEELEDGDKEDGEKVKPSKGATTLVKQQMNKIKKQHTVQLIGMLKWTTGLTEYANIKINQEEYLENYDLKINNIGALGLFTMQNRIYITKLTVQNLTETDMKCAHNVVRCWGMLPRGQVLGRRPIRLSYPTSWGCPPKMKACDVYLDIFNPIHLKALLMFLRIALWGEFQVSV